MIRVLLQGHTLTGPVEEILRPFTTDVPKSHIEPGGRLVVDGGGGDFLLTSAVSNHGTVWTVETCDDRNASMALTLTIDSAIVGTRSSPVPVPVRREVKRQLYFLLSARTGIHPPWGSLTGVRPTVLGIEMLDAGLDPASSARELEARFGVSSAKASLAVRTARAEAEILDAMPVDEACIYVSIPFCSTRCSYCSFPSCTVDRVQDRLPAYVDAVLLEAERIGERLASENRTAGCLYIGGGSPAVLPAELIDRMLRGLRRRIPFECGCESTFEAGRSDDLDADRLAAISGNSIDRICLNPQTTDPSTLARIGRPDPGGQLGHWAREARRTGIRTLSMDLIAGLPGEDVDSFRKSLEDVLSLHPENITVHALSRKRGSRLYGEARRLELCSGAATEMVDFAHRNLEKAGYAPYYLYRQKDTVDGLENTGFALPGTACRYNVGMMSDRRDVFGLGAGASTKRLRPGTSSIDRSVHPLDLAAYLEWVARTYPPR